MQKEGKNDLSTEFTTSIIKLPQRLRPTTHNVLVTGITVPYTKRPGSRPEVKIDLTINNTTGLQRSSKSQSRTFSFTKKTAESKTINLTPNKQTPKFFVENKKNPLTKAPLSMQRVKMHPKLLNKGYHAYLSHSLSVETKKINYVKFHIPKDHSESSKKSTFPKKEAISKSQRMAIEIKSLFSNQCRSTLASKMSKWIEESKNQEMLLKGIGMSISSISRTKKPTIKNNKTIPGKLFKSLRYDQFSDKINHEEDLQPWTLSLYPCFKEDQAMERSISIKAPFQSNCE